jgi:hypothetical protein
MENTLRLGVIGSSPGNGHPYSWSAICNGYDDAAMAQCPYPAIPAYLRERRFPEDQLADTRVTHVWTQDRGQSAHIAAASLIPNIVSSPGEMIGKIDALLLARDDAENHAGFAVPFLQAGIPVLIDKPLALTMETAGALLALEGFPGQILAGTPLTGSAEFQLTEQMRSRLGPIRYVSATTPKYWKTYAVHVIEPVLSMLNRFEPPADMRAWRDRDRTALSVRWTDGVAAQFHCLGNLSAPIAIDVHGESDNVRLVFKDSFSAFRAALQRFCDGIRQRKRMFNVDLCLATTRLIEHGCEARESI